MNVKAPSNSDERWKGNCSALGLHQDQPTIKSSFVTWPVTAGLLIIAKCCLFSLYYHMKTKSYEN